jgi:putative flavoprotein involved in K+ transport
MSEQFETVVVGAGQAGLAMSYSLRRRRRDHIVLERGRVGETWRTQRWDSFTLNTPNWMNALPGAIPAGRAAEAFSTHRELVNAFERYTFRFGLPIRTGTAVTAVEETDEGYVVGTTAGTIVASNVVVASGSQNVPRVPALAAELPEEVDQLHAADYMRPEILRRGAILVVGSAQSGVQIAEELVEGQRRVYLATSRVGRIPRRYRGRDIAEWLRDTGHADLRTDELEDPRARFQPQPQVTGAHGGHTVSLQQLSRLGVVMLGRLESVAGERLYFGDDLAENVAFADASSDRIARMIDEHIRHERILAPPAEDDPADRPGRVRVGPRELDLEEDEIRTVIWATGFTGDYSWIGLDVLDEHGRPRHDSGVAAGPGLYFVGLPWLTKRKSGILYGIAEDAARIAGLIADRAPARTRIPRRARAA